MAAAADSAFRTGTYAGEWSGCCADGKIVIELKGDRSGNINALRVQRGVYGTMRDMDVRSYKAAGNRIEFTIRFAPGDERDPQDTTFSGDLKGQRIEGKFETRWAISGVMEDFGTWSAAPAKAEARRASPSRSAATTFARKPAAAAASSTTR